MKSLLIYSAALAAAVLTAAFLEPLAARCRRRRDAEDATGSPTPAPMVDTVDSRSHSQHEARSHWALAGESLRQLLSREGALALSLALLLLAFLPLNASILADGLEILWNRPGQILGELPVAGGITREITDLQMAGLAVSLALVLNGAVFGALRQARSGWCWSFFVVGVVPTVGFETLLAAWRGYALAVEDPESVAAGAPGVLALANGLQAFICASAEAIAGHWAVLHFLVPITLTVAWTTLGILRWVLGLLASGALGAGGLVRSTASYRPAGLLIRIAALLDEAFFEPLRALDQLTLRLIHRLMHLRWRRALAILIVIVGVPASSDAASRGPCVFMIGLDASRSVPAAEFAHYPDIVRTAFLELLQPRDSVVLIRLDRPRAEPRVFTLGSRLDRFRRLVRNINDEVRAVSQDSAPHGTDLGALFDHARRRIDLDRLIQQHDSPACYIVGVVTDGLPDGKQTVPPAGPVRAPYHVIAIGVAPQHDRLVRGAAERAGFDDRARTLIVPYSHWHGVSASLTSFIGRPRNASLAAWFARPIHKQEMKR